MGPGITGTDDLSAKHLFDSIGQKVHNKVDREDANYRKYLHGYLEKAIFEELPEGKQTPKDACDLDHTYHTTVTVGFGKENPCKDNPDVRFSYAEGAQCHPKKIKESKGKDGGACAPFRRLNLCDRNLEHIDPDKVTTDNLLADVCMAAKFEADSLERDRAKYQEQHKVAVPICTELARSFADIGDIIRGRDLYIRDERRKRSLEIKLGKIFAKIYENLMNDLEKETTMERMKKKEAEARYNDPKGKFFKLREDWWDANRATVWKAITCGNAGGKYFRKNACSGRETNSKCQCGNPANVPTYFDYVPQFLRWFEEWAEDFCRKKKKKLEDVKTNCRGKDGSGNDRYCDRNGFDCERTKYKISYFVIDKNCKTCSVSCRPYESWIANQKDVFLKQKKKSENEVQKYENGESRGGGGRKKRDTSSSEDYKVYEKHFYEILKHDNVGGLEKFLELLNKETDCQNIDGKGGEIDFTKNVEDDKNNKTFYRSDYCEPCPECGVEHYGGNQWKPKSGDQQCTVESEYNPNGAKETNINILYSGEGPEDMTKKLSEFCKDSTNKDGEKNEKWKCYYENANNNMCKMTNTGTNDKKHAKMMSFNDFFYFWVGHLLTDTINWRKELNRCIKAAKSKTCEKKCNTKCDCYKQWIEKKKDEWKQVKDQYDEQKDMGDFSPYWTLEFDLKEELLPIIEKNNSDLESIKEMRKIIEKNHNKYDLKREDENAIDALLKYEEQDANTCVENDPQKNCKPKKPKQTPASELGRSETDENDVINQKEDDESSSEHSDIGSEDEDEVEEEESVTENTEEVPGPPARPQEPVEPQEDKVKPCEIVQKLFSDPSQFNDACGTKYDKYGKERFTQWYCGGKTTDKDGAICIPPRRRRLYIGKIKEWATKTETESTSLQNGYGASGERGSKVSGSESQEEEEEQQQQQQQQKLQTSTEASGTPEGASPSHPRDVDGLLEAFVESAAIETFFLWDRYKKLNSKKPDSTMTAQDVYGNYGSSADGTDRLFGKSSGGMTVLSASSLPGQTGALVPGVLSGSPESPFPSAPGTGGPPPPLGPIPPVLPVPPGFPPGPQIPVPQPPPSSSSEEGTHDSLLNTPNALGSLGSDDPSNHPETLLSSGVIPPDFLRQMFYTLGDYRDILVGDTTANGALSKEEQSKMETIKEEIDKIIPKNSDNQPQSRETPVQSSDTPVQSSGKSLSTSGTTPSSWWKENGPHIWDGMLCALTYKDNSDGPRGGKPQKIDNADDVLTKLKEKNDYKTVTLEDENSGDTEALAQDAPQTASPTSTATGSTTLAEFVTRPAYFRWLEEWGENFCVKRTEMLAKIKEECRSDKPGKRYCSGDGHDCEKEELTSNKIFVDLHCRGCGEQCMKYKTWIKKKKTEFENQKNKYDGELQKLEDSSKNDGDDNKEFCEEMQRKKHTSAEKFLKTLKHCKNVKDDTDKDNKEYELNKIDFDKIPQTFSPSTYCKTCPTYGVTCLRRGGKDVCSPKENNDNRTEGVATPIPILIDDGTTNDIYQELKNCSEKYSFLKGLTKQQWKCQKNNGVDKCNLTNTVNETYFDKDISFNEFLQRWLRYFVQDYNKLKENINVCIKKKKEKEDKCIQGCNDKCKCAEEWLEIKEKEWEMIKNYYNQNFETKNEHIAYWVKSYFQQGLFESDYKKAQEVVGKKCDKEKLWGCTGDNLNDVEDQKQENCHKGDFITNLIEKLKQKTTSCKQKHNQPSGENSGQTCSPPPPQPPDHEEEEYENEHQNKNPHEAKKNMMPDICKGVVETQKPETVEELETCDKAADEKVDQTVEKPETNMVTENASDTESTGDNKGEDSVEPTPLSPSKEGNSEQTPFQNPDQDVESKVEKKNKIPAIKEPKTKPQPTKPKQGDENPHKLNMLPSLFPLTVGVGFLALSYWVLLKKKSKPPVDLFSVLEIPQNDYGIPTTKSSNRYIPYASGKYRGKRYIYIEGDSSGDEKYAFMSDTTDVTSSESEYEELDINDIYVPHAPKYKTLIEVVLEPSKRDTQNDIQSDDIPSNKITDIEWNELKQNFISQYLPNIQPNDYTSGNSPTNTYPTMTRHNMEEKPFIMSIQDRNLYSGDEVIYNINGDVPINANINTTTNNTTNDSLSGNHHPYSGIDLINDTLSGGNHDIYDEVLKRKENELFGTKHHPKRTSNNSVVKLTNSDPIHNQINLFHKWLDRHRNMCEKWENHHERLAKLKEKWENETHSGNKTSANITPTSDNTPPNSDNIPPNSDNIPPNSDNIPPNSDIPSGKLSDTPNGKLSDIFSDNNIHSDIPYVLNTDVSIQIDMDTNEVDDIYLDTYPDKYTVENINPVDENPPIPNQVQIEMSVKNTQMVKEKYPIGDVWDI
ncbi:erythrocyte membrane protein 1, EMP1 [Plasmodium reichenowi]|uniref:Erythrocyte membrane protein 1, EMP1 n=1 Tax=Plasmodium reichenowi TaxID=5854 RepID=A0A060RMK9_PLARE|nr:erythrocyte membrane protein 1, EMP1 [Plasmodium reichenowi]